MPAPTKAEAARIKLKDLSPVFRVLAEKADALALSDPQKRFLQRLEEITREGLFCLGNAKDAGLATAAQVSRGRAEFARHAEQVALFGVLTEKQAEQVRSAIE